MRRTASGQANAQTASRRVGESATAKLAEIKDRPKSVKSVSKARENIYRARG